MESDLLSVSVISLSSSETSASDEESLNSILTVSSDAQRVPVRSKNGQLSRLDKCILIEDEIPNHTEKVNNWICGYESETRSSVDSNKDNEKSTCIRYDFDKSPRAASIPKSCFTQTTPLFSYMEEAKKNNCSKVPQKVNGADEPPKTQTQTNLNLMKDGDESNDFFRRSDRVKNLPQDNNKPKGKKKEEKDNKELKVKTSKLGKLFSLKRKKSNSDVEKNYMPLPPNKVYSEVCDFESSIQDLIKDKLEQERVNEKKEKQKNQVVNTCLKKVEKRRKFKFGPKKYKKTNFTKKSIISVKSSRHLHNGTSETLNENQKKKTRKKFLKKIKDPTPAETSKCEIVSIHTNSDDENIDLKNFVDDMLELDKMSEEHRKSVIESRILAASSITNLISKISPKEADLEKALKIFADLKKNEEEKENTADSEQKETTETAVAETETTVDKMADNVYFDHDYVNFDIEVEEAPDDDSLSHDDVESDSSLSPVSIKQLPVIPFKNSVEVKSLQRSLTATKRKPLNSNNRGLHNFHAMSNLDKKLNHSITISKHDGALLRACYQDFNLVVVQQNSVSFWTQSALGNVLGAQNMWIPKGQIQRIPLNSTYIQKNAMEMVITTETSIAYVELWSKEHKSELRELPIADVFATVYFWRLRQSGLEKKALQLENIKGFPDDVQYCVLKCYPKIIVSWHSVLGNEKKTKIHSYHIAADFQTVASISEIQPVEHYVASLHNIEDCDNLVMGCGENKVTLWNVEYGYIVATIEMSNIKLPLSTLWVKCDRGFLFTVQECVDQELRLIAINGMNLSWKKLQNYSPLPGFHCLKGVYIDNGILVAYYTEGILCWNAQSGELLEEVPNEGEYIPSGKHVIMLDNETIVVRHSLSHLLADL